MVQYIKKSDYETAHFDDEWIVLNTDNYTVTKLNETGGFCWSLLDKPQTVEALCDDVQQKFGADSKDVKEDVEAFLADLLKCGLIDHDIR
jgi:hypothetical protein